MHVIKKYANRKLYHTNQKQYITLDGIAKLIQEGESVQVLDNETGEDITASILSQVVLQTRGRNTNQLPTSVLAGLIQFGGDTIAGLRRTIFGQTDAFNAEISRRIERLVAENAITAAEGNRWRLLLLRKDIAEGAPPQAVPALDLPSRADLEKLNNQVDALAAAVEYLLREQTAEPGAKTPES